MSITLSLTLNLMRLLLADDHPLLIDGLLAVLREVPHLELLPPVNNGHQVIDFLHKHRVDLLLLDQVSIMEPLFIY